MSIRNIIKKWLGLQADIDQAVSETREQVTRQLTSEKNQAIAQMQRDRENAIAQLSKQHGEEVAALRKQMADSQEQAEKERKAYADLQARLDKYRQVAEKMKVQRDGPGRPALTIERVRFNLQLDVTLKETIAILESAGVIKRGAVTERIHQDLYRWLTPLREELERTLPFDDGGVLTDSGDASAAP